jgi:hypothetical protein
VHDALGDPLAVEARELLDQVLVLEQYRAARACGLRILVVGDRCAGFGAERPGHRRSLLVSGLADRRVGPACDNFQ